MRHESLNEEGQESAALYALGALSQNEARAFEIHLLEGCSVCREQLDEFERVTGTLGSSAQAVAPPAYLRDLLKARIERESEAAHQAEPAQASVIPFPEQHKRPGSAPKQRRPSTIGTWLPWAVAATLLIGLLGSLLLWQQDKRALQASINESKNETLVTIRERDEIRESLREQETTAEELTAIKSILAVPNRYEVLSLKATGNAPETMHAPSGTVYWNKGDQKWVVTADLPQPPEGKAYQLWFITPGAPVSAGMLKPDETGHGFLIINVPQSVPTIVAAAITLEPQEGSPQPTTPVLAIGKAA